MTVITYNVIYFLDFIMTNSSCLFCNIVNKTVKSFVVWEDEKYIAFLTPFPNTKGFTVVMPKQHYSSYIFAVPDDIMTGLMHAAKKVASLLEKGLMVKRCAVVFEGFGINHLMVVFICFRYLVWSGFWCL